MSKLSDAHAVIDAVFLYAALTEHGFVKVGISRKPYERIYQIHCNSPSQVMAAQWVWVGGVGLGRKIESAVRARWKKRNTRGEWYWFDYENSSDKIEFKSGIDAVFLDCCKVSPEWKKLGPEDIAALARDIITHGGKKKYARGA